MTLIENDRTDIYASVPSVNVTTNEFYKSSKLVDKYSECQTETFSSVKRCTRHLLSLNYNPRSRSKIRRSMLRASDKKGMLILPRKRGRRKGIHRPKSFPLMKDCRRVFEKASKKRMSQSIFLREVKASEKYNSRKLNLSNDINEDALPPDSDISETDLSALSTKTNEDSARFTEENDPLWLPGSLSTDCGPTSCPSTVQLKSDIQKKYNACLEFPSYNSIRKYFEGNYTTVKPMFSIYCSLEVPFSTLNTDDDGKEVLADNVPNNSTEAFSALYLKEINAKTTVGNDAQKQLTCSDRISTWPLELTDLEHSLLPTINSYESINWDKLDELIVTEAKCDSETQIESIDNGEIYENSQSQVTDNYYSQYQDTENIPLAPQAPSFIDSIEKESEVSEDSDNASSDSESMDESCGDCVLGFEASDAKHLKSKLRNLKNNVSHNEETVFVENFEVSNEVSKTVEVDDITDEREESKNDHSCTTIQDAMKMVLLRSHHTFTSDPLLRTLRSRDSTFSAASATCHSFPSVNHHIQQAVQSSATSVISSDAEGTADNSVGGKKPYLRSEPVDKSGTSISPVTKAVQGSSFPPAAITVQQSVSVQTTSTSVNSSSASRYNLRSASSKRSYPDLTPDFNSKHLKKVKNMQTSCDNSNFDYLSRSTKANSCKYIKINCKVVKTIRLQSQTSANLIRSQSTSIPDSSSKQSTAVQKARNSSDVNCNRANKSVRLLPKLFPLALPHRPVHLESLLLKKPYPTNSSVSFVKSGINSVNVSPSPATITGTAPPSFVTRVNDTLICVPSYVNLSNNAVTIPPQPDTSNINFHGNVTENSYISAGTCNVAVPSAHPPYSEIVQSNFAPSANPAVVLASNYASQTAVCETAAQTNFGATQFVPVDKPNIIYNSVTNSQHHGNINTQVLMSTTNVTNNNMSVSNQSCDGRVPMTTDSLLLGSQSASASQHLHSTVFNIHSLPSTLTPSTGNSFQGTKSFMGQSPVTIQNNSNNDLIDQSLVSQQISTPLQTNEMLPVPRIVGGQSQTGSMFYGVSPSSRILTADFLPTDRISAESNSFVNISSHRFLSSQSTAAIGSAHDGGKQSTDENAKSLGNSKIKIIGEVVQAYGSSEPMYVVLPLKETNGKLYKIAPVGDSDEKFSLVVSDEVVTDSTEDTADTFDPVISNVCSLSNKTISSEINDVSSEHPDPYVNNSDSVLVDNRVIQESEMEPVIQNCFSLSNVMQT